MRTPLFWTLCVTLICFSAIRGLGAPAAPDPRIPNPATAPANAASTVVQKFLDLRASGDMKAAYTLLTQESQKQIPASEADMDQAIKMFDNPQMMQQFTPEFKAVIALFVDRKGTLGYKYRVLGPATDDANVILVRAYRVGTPLTETKIIKVITAVDTAASGTIRIDGLQTAMRADPNMMKARGTAQQATATSNLKQIALGIIMYAQDNNKLPDADKWVDEIMPYVKTEALFRDQYASGRPWAYAYNQNLSGVRMAQVNNPASTVLVYESTLGTKNASDTGASLPQPGRHQGASLFAFVDGHVKPLPDGSKPVFALNSTNVAPASP